MIPDFCGPRSDLICTLGEYEHVKAQVGNDGCQWLSEDLMDVGTSLTAHEVVPCHHLPALG